MTFDHWLAFVAATVVLLSIPGPTTILVISHAISHGRTAAKATVTGVALGDLCAMTASIVGLGAVLSASATLFMIVKVAGAAYLVFLGIRLWQADTGHLGLLDAHEPESYHPRRIFLHSFAVTVLNPKSIVFFVAFLPQFLDASRPMLPQFLAFVATFVALSLGFSTTWSLVATAARSAIRQPWVQRIVNRTGGSMMIGAGLFSILWKRG
ncbi:MAG: LysE family translocator [Thermomicrobiales bacterium]